MAARKGPLTVTKLDEMRRRINTTLLMKRLEDHALGIVEMKTSEIRAAEVVLRKAIPDLSSMEVTGEGGGAVQHAVAVTFVGMK